MKKPKISVIIPVYNEKEHITKTVDSLKNQDFEQEIEIVVFDDCSTDKTYEIVKSCRGIRVFRNEKKLGPAKTRNNAIKKASAEILAFIDADCVAQEKWLKNIYSEFQNPEIKVIVGKVKIPPSTYLGNCISALGFPGGGSIGFENMWHVSKDGFTNHITSCNFASRKKVFEKYGLFDESFPFPGGEDPELSYRWNKKGVKIKYWPKMIVAHRTRKNFYSFVKWMFKRGRSNYYFKNKVGKIGNFITLRIWSSKNIIRKFIFDPKIFLIVPLLFMSFVLQQLGYFYEAARHIKKSSSK